jgi:hypothetical protein
MGTSTHDDLCKVAYRLWEERGCPDGSPEVDWQRAEEELGQTGRPENESASTVPSALAKDDAGGHPHHGSPS